MLNYQKLSKQLHEVSGELFEGFDHEIVQAKVLWNQAVSNSDLNQIIRSKKWSISVPFWQGNIAQCVPVISQGHPYQVLAVDGSQIYYDRHQAPSCYLLNVGSCFLAYQAEKSRAQFDSDPKIVIPSEQVSKTDVESINAQREILEFEHMQAQALDLVGQYGNQSFLCLFDGSLLFMQKDQMFEQQKALFARYIKVLQTLMDHQILYAGYISFPASKELLNVVKLVQANFDEKKLQSDRVLHRLTDADIAAFFLKSGYRSNLFEMKNFLSYLYPELLKPYFCYVHVGFEIVRLEIPAWIAKNEILLHTVCGIVQDQVQKGFGYPVCLFEAHQQAVIKNYDRELFYQMMQKVSHQKNRTYQISLKSIKKASMPV